MWDKLREVVVVVFVLAVAFSPLVFGFVQGRKDKQEWRKAHEGYINADHRPSYMR